MLIFKSYILPPSNSKYTNTLDNTGDFHIMLKKFQPMRAFTINWIKRQSIKQGSTV